MKLPTTSAPSDAGLPISLAVTSATSRIMLVVACLGIAIAAVAMIKVHNAHYELTAYRASRVAGAGVLLCFVALAAALYVSSGT